MSRISACFAQLANANKTALIPFITAGDPTPDLTVPLMHALVKGGADILELGIPFSDPMADGPTIQRASERALAKGMNLSKVLACCAEFRLTNQTTPVVLMGYANPIERMGQSQFIAAAAQAGVDGVLVVDYPPEECAEFVAELRQNLIDAIFLLAPTSTEERMRQVGELASGYVYYVSLKGVTGSAALNVSRVAEVMPKLRQHVRVPIGVGFGIRDGETARALAEHCDAVVIGSRIIEEIENVAIENAINSVEGFISGVRTALDR